jgi:NAD(P)-dependent dehydrogenase (short-subunit alcohol dehydrogenase family)
VQGLKGRSYIVTGAASGIGWATAIRLLTEGALVMGADINEPPQTPPGTGPATALGPSPAPT